MANNWASYLHKPCYLRGPEHCEARDKVRSGPQVAASVHNPCRMGGAEGCTTEEKISTGPQLGHVASKPLPDGGPQKLHSGRQNRMRPTSGPAGYITLGALGVHVESLQGTKSQVDYKWAGWLHNPCHVKSWQLVKAEGHNWKWPTNGPGCYITPAAEGVTIPSSRGEKIRAGPKMWCVAFDDKL